VQASADNASTPKTPARRALTALAFVAALFGLALQPPPAAVARGASGAPAADITHTVDRSALKPAQAELKAPAHKRVGANPGPTPIALVSPACAAPAAYGGCPLPFLYAGIHAPRSFTIVAQPRAPPIRRT